MSDPLPQSSLHLGVDLSDAGARPAAWRAVGSQARRLFDAGRLAELVATAQRGVLDLVVLDDAFSLRPGPGGEARGGLDAAVVASRLAPVSAGIGIVPTVSTSSADPSNVSTALATIDHASDGRAGWQVGWSSTHAGTGVDLAERSIETVVRSWDDRERAASGGDGPEAPADADGGVLRHVDHEGIRFAVRGPATSPRLPQGRPPVVVRLESPDALALVARHADVVRVRAATLGEAVTVRSRVRDAAAVAGRDPGLLRVLVDAYVVVGETRASAQARLDLLEDLEGVTWDTGSLTHVGTARDLAVTVEEWTVAGAADGFLLRPSSLGTDLDAIVDVVVPALQGAGLFRTEYPGTTLRETLGLPHPANRYAAIA